MKKTKIRRIGVFTSGGDAPGMNACIRAITRAAIRQGLQVYGIEQGYKGMIEGKMRPLTWHSVSGILQLGGTILKSARSDAFRTKEGRAIAFEQLKHFGIDALVAIGGDGTFRGALEFMNEYDIPIVGCPGTIDNDIYGTDYTIGYDTATNTAMWAIDKIKDTANAHDRLFFVEVMGRDAGFIALRSGIATGAEAVLVPEQIVTIENLLAKLGRILSHRRRSCIVVVAEGDELGGAIDIAKKVQGQFKDYDIRITILGHIQRGGSPTCFDRVLASQLGIEAVQALLNGQTGVMIGKRHEQIVQTPFEKAVKYHHELNPTLLKIIDILS